VTSDLITERTVKEMKVSLAQLLKGLEGEYPSIDGRINRMLTEINKSEATFVFSQAVSAFVKVRKSEALKETGRISDEFKKCLGKLKTINLDYIDPNSRDAIDQSIKLLSEQESDVTLILESMTKALNSLSRESESARQKSKQIIGDDHDHLKHNGGNIVAADVQSASLRLGRDLKSICNALINTYPTDKTVRNLHSRIQEVGGKANTFFTSLEIMGELSNYLKSIISRSGLHTQEMLASIQEQVLEMCSQSAALQELSIHSSNNTDTMQDDVTKKLETLRLRAKQCKSVEESHALLSESIDSVNELIEQYVNVQQKVNLSNRNKINSLNNELNTAVGKIKKLNTQISTASDELLIDELTKVGNRKGYTRRLESEIKRLKSNNINTLALVIFDIDNFKSVNDNFGHVIGDKVISRVADITVNMIPKSCYFARYGGEEFVLICPDITNKVAASLAHKIKNQIASREFKLKGRDEPIKITISAGVSQFSSNLDYPSKVFEDADRALYMAKNRGRDKVVVCLDQQFLTLKDN
jgi:diguanylate cyclase (GGDEF)-like protein